MKINSLCFIMGRTIPTYRMAVDQTEQKFKHFRRALRPLYRERFDEIFDYARMHGDAGTMVNIPNKMDIELLSVLIELISRIEELEVRINERDT